MLLSINNVSSNNINKCSCGYIANGNCVQCYQESDCGSTQFCNNYSCESKKADQEACDEDKECINGDCHIYVTNLGTAGKCVSNNCSCPNGRSTCFSVYVLKSIF